MNWLLFYYLSCLIISILGPGHINKYFIVICLYTDETLQSAGYIKWSPGEPAKGNTYNCGVFKSYKGLGITRYDGTLCYICELEI